MKSTIARSVHIKGLVQGVGFRPFVYRLASRHNLTGWVENGNDGVRIHAEGSVADLNGFITCLSLEAPDASQILEIIVSDSERENENSFRIRKSADYSDEVTEISPDISVCDQCLEDMHSQAHRIEYSFINCTNCGPRFSIIKGLPYDRANTSMQPFEMCPECGAEYSDVNNRRFHAQPIACNHCGPRYELVEKSQTLTGMLPILERLVSLIKSGKIIAIKGIGGFHLACDATNEEAVSMLRSRKNREGKPFAVMFKDIFTLRKYAEINSKEKSALLSWRRPIVIVKNQTINSLAPSVSNGFGTSGVMLPYMPLHYLLFEKLDVPAIVLTSGNLSDEPVIIGNPEALDRLKYVADAFLLYNRDIWNRTDDSVMMFTGPNIRMIRRSRGFAPSPVNMKMNVDGIFAAGAELVNCFCLGKDQKAIMSQHIGDVKNLETLVFYSETLERYQELFRIKPTVVVCDLHPDYLSTRFAHDFAKRKGIKHVEAVQHHHAHIAACMAEHGVDETVIGVSLDGVGYGADGNIWGFEFMICDLAGFKRELHLEYVPQPGGDKANHEPWRMALAYLHQYVSEDINSLDLEFLKDLEPDKITMICTAIKNRINCPLTSSAGRLFDAVAAMVGICNYTSFHAEAPMRLENIMDSSETGRYGFNTGSTIDPGQMIRSIVTELAEKVPASVIATKFHRTIVEIIIDGISKISQATTLKKVVLSGGTFQNKFILEECENRLKEMSFQVYTHHDFPSNDGGIALGQLVIAARRRDAGILSRKEIQTS
jgi:hydrogenase maturation protein HypF